MTREEFIKKHGDDFLGKLHRACFSEKNAIFMRWLQGVMNELDIWLGTIHDAATEIARNGTQSKIGPPSKPTAGGPTVPQTPPGSNRNAA